MGRAVQPSQGFAQRLPDCQVALFWRMVAGECWQGDRNSGVRPAVRI